MLLMLVFISYRFESADEIQMLNIMLVLDNILTFVLKCFLQIKKR